MSQLSFSSLDYATKKKLTKREVFLAEMSAVVPWGALEAVIAPHYPAAPGPQGGRRAFPLAVMLRIYCLQQWYQLSDPGAEEALYDIQSMRAFGIPALVASCSRLITLTEPNQSKMNSFMRGRDPGSGSQSLALEVRLSWTCHQ